MAHEGRTVLRISAHEAQGFVKRHEHLGNIGLGVWHWGLFEQKILLGVVSYGTTCFSRGRGWLARAALEAGCGIVQLCRGARAVRAAKNTASQLISRANGEMARIRGPLIIVAYADPTFGEIGTIYQACNAYYLGTTDPKGQADYVICGRKMSGWLVRKTFGTRDRRKLREIDPDVRVIELHQKHRYAMVAGPRLVRRRLRRMLAPHVRPYPKREKLGVLSMPDALEGAGLPALS